MVTMCQKISEPIEQRLSIDNVDELDFINSIADKVAQVSHVHVATCSGIVLDFYRVLQDVEEDTWTVRCFVRHWLEPYNQHFVSTLYGGEEAFENCSKELTCTDNVVIFLQNKYHLISNLCDAVGIATNVETAMKLFNDAVYFDNNVPPHIEEEERKYQNMTYKDFQ